MSNIKVLSDYIKAVTKNIRLEENLNIDLVISGGAFNGVIALGSIMLIKQLELEGKLKVDRVSGCSIGSCMAVVYLANSFEKTNNIFNKLKTCLQTKGNLSELNDILKEWVYDLFDSDEEMKKILDNRCFISYNDITNCEFCTINKYENRDHLISCLMRSCFIPIIINGNLKVDDNYIDGVVPYIFKDSKNKVLYLELMKSNIEMMKSFITKNENNEHYRVLKGVTDAAKFFSENKSSRLSWYKDWSILKITKYNIYYLTCMIICFFLDFLSSFKLQSMLNENKLIQFINNCLINSFKDIIGALNN